MNRYKFTGKERDGGTGLDYFGARYYSGRQGRFTSADETLGDQDNEDPQSWNLYSYVRNSPLRYVDADGRACVSSDGGRTYHDDNSGGQSCKEAEEANKKKKPDVVVTARLPNDALSPFALAVLQQVYRQSAGITRPGTIAQFYAASAVAGAAGAAYGAVSGGGLLVSNLTVVGPVGGTTVYLAVQGGAVRYIGITGDLIARAAAHARAGLQIRAIPGLDAVRRAEARAVEQVLIELHGLGKTGGTLLNRINSVAQENPVYAESLRRGREILKRIGYPGVE